MLLFFPLHGLFQLQHALGHPHTTLVAWPYHHPTHLRVKTQPYLWHPRSAATLMASLLCCISAFTAKLFLSTSTTVVHLIKPSNPHCYFSAFKQEETLRPTVNAHPAMSAGRVPLPSTVGSKNTKHTHLEQRFTFLPRYSGQVLLLNRASKKTKGDALLMDALSHHPNTQISVLHYLPSVFCWWRYCQSLPTKGKKWLFFPPHN